MAYLSQTSRFAGKHLAAASAAISFAVLPVLAHAQAPAAQQAAPTLQTVAYSSSSDAQSRFAGEDIDGQSLASAPNGTTKTLAAQYGGGYGGGHYHRYDDNSRFSHIAFEVGGGFTAPIGNTVNGGFTTILAVPGTVPVNYGTSGWGGNLLGGAGWSFSKRFTLMGEVQYNTTKIPGRTLSAFYDESGLGDNSEGITNIGGNVHSYGYIAEPMYTYYAPEKHNYSAYVLGGVGFYHRSINFTAPVESESYYGGIYVTNQTFSSYTDNSLGLNLGTGISFKPFGEYSRAKLFAEARYVFINSPSESVADLSNGNVLHTGTQEVIPVTVGFRF